MWACHATQVAPADSSTSNHGRFEDAEATRKVFEKQIEDVKAIVPQQRLMVFGVHEGWGPLCEFLGVPVPEKTSFPHENKRAGRSSE
jgi:hypothetical protein